MPGNDLTALRAIVPQPSTTRAQSRAWITELLTSILDDIEPKVTAAQININSDLSFNADGTRYAATDMSYLGLEQGTADTTTVSSVYTKNGDLYYHDVAGNKVRLTSSGQVNSAAGNITGTGYGSSDVEVAWHAGTAEYRFKAGTDEEDLADLVMDKARFSDGTGSDYATLGAQAGMTGVVDYALPIAAPSTITEAVIMDTSGNMDTTAALSITTVTASGDMSADEYKITGTKTISMQGSAWVARDSGGAYNGAAECITTGFPCYMPVPLTIGDRITNVSVYAEQDAAGTLTLSLYSVSELGVRTLEDSDTGTGTARQNLNLTLLTETIASDKTYMLQLDSSNGSAEITCGNAEIIYDRP